MTKYSPEVEQMMIKQFKSLNEKERRRYAVLEVIKLGRGGQKYIAELFGISKTTIIKGIKELKEETYWEAVQHRLRTNVGIVLPGNNQCYTHFKNRRI